MAFPRSGILIGLLFAGCVQQRIAIYETNGANLNQQDGQWVFENDTVMVRYSFWTEGGKLSFAVYNKTSKPLFIDWKNSALVLNDKKVEYWNDAARTTTSSSTIGITSSRSRSAPSNSFDWSWITRSNTLGASLAVSDGVMVKDERITSLPPRTYIGVNKYAILSTRLDHSTLAPRTVSEPDANRPEKMEMVEQVDFSANTSPIRFRNFLAFSFTEEMRDPFYTDDSFWLSGIMDMTYVHYQGKYLGKDGDGYAKYEKPYRTPSRFYWRYTK